MPVELMWPAPSKLRTTAPGCSVTAWLQAASRAASAPRSTSPARSITATPSRRRTAGLSLVAIVFSLQAQGELEGVVLPVARLARLVDHVLDQEQPPAARALQPRELGLDVRLLALAGLGRRGRAAEVGDLDAHAPVTGQHAHADRAVGAVLGAVLHGVHRRLADGGLEPLEAGLGDPERRDRGGHMLDRPALVALGAGDLELGEQLGGHGAVADVRGAGRALEHD